MRYRFEAITSDGKKVFVEADAYQDTIRSMRDILIREGMFEIIGQSEDGHVVMVISP